MSSYAAAMMHGIAHTSLKILGVRFTDTLSVSVHVDDVINSSALSMYAMRVLQSYEMSVSALQQVFPGNPRYCHLEAHLCRSGLVGLYQATTSTDAQAPA